MGARRTRGFLAAIVAAAFALASCRDAWTFLSVITAKDATLWPAHNSRVANAGGAAVVLATAGATPVFAEETSVPNIVKSKVDGFMQFFRDLPPSSGLLVLALLVVVFLVAAGISTNEFNEREADYKAELDKATLKVDESKKYIAEAEKVRAQADLTIAEINATMDKESRAYKDQTDRKAYEARQKERQIMVGIINVMQEEIAAEVDVHIEKQYVKLGLEEMEQLSTVQQQRFTDIAIEML